jgi:hypothetical protein
MGVVNYNPKFDSHQDRRQVVDRVRVHRRDDRVQSPLGPGLPGSTTCRYVIAIVVRKPSRCTVLTSIHPGGRRTRTCTSNFRQQGTNGERAPEKERHPESQGVWAPVRGPQFIIDIDSRERR